jgi:hypothetical protein
VIRSRTLREAIGRIVLKPLRNSRGRKFVAVHIEGSLVKDGAVLSPGQARQLARALVELAEQQERWGR